MSLASKLLRPPRGLAGLMGGEFGCTLIKDRHGAVYAAQNQEETEDDVLRVATRLAKDASADEGERIRVGISKEGDPGAARLDDDARWLYTATWRDGALVRTQR